MLGYALIGIGAFSLYCSRRNARKQPGTLPHGETDRFQTLEMEKNTNESNSEGLNSLIFPDVRNSLNGRQTIEKRFA